MKRYILCIVACFFFFSVSFAQQQQTPAANVILKKAYSEASTNNKNILLLFHASWCGWCHKMDSSLNDPSCKKAFADNYIICHLTVDESEDRKNLENLGASAFRDKLGGAGQGLPYWAILDKSGKLLANSKIPEVNDNKGGNVGCPAAVEEVAYFVKVLKETSKLTDQQLSVIANRFRLNETE